MTAMMYPTIAYDVDIESNFTCYVPHIAIDVKPEVKHDQVKRDQVKRDQVKRDQVKREPVTVKQEYISIAVAPSITIVKTINIQIKSATGKIIIININPLETILKLKKQIYISQDLSLDSQRIVFEGKQLEDHKRICDYNIKDESVVHIVLRLRGGMFHKSSSRIDWISLNYLDKMERGLSMLEYMKREASDKLYIIFEDFEEMLKTSRDDYEIDMIYALIRNIYIE
jgi:hypothetical protein